MSKFWIYYRVLGIAKQVGDLYTIITVITTQSLTDPEIIIMIIIICIGLVPSKQVSGVVPVANERTTPTDSNASNVNYRKKIRGGENTQNLSLIHI